MTTSIRQQTAVAIDATHWDVGGYRIWESTEPGLLLYARHDLRLATDSAGRPFAAVTRYLDWNGTSYRPTGGSAVLGLLGAGPDEAAVLLSLQDEWTRVIRASGYDRDARGVDPRYVPLPIRDAVLSAQLDPGHATVAAGQAGCTLQVELTAAGAAAWAAAVTDGAPVAGTVRLTYAYPRLMPPATALVRVHGQRVYDQLAATLTTAADGELSGTEAEMRTAWAGLVHSGAIEVSLTGSAASTLSLARDALVEQARENLFDTMFVHRPAAAAAPPRLALRWKRAADMPDLPLMVSVEGWTWLNETLEASVAELLSQVGPGALHEVYPSVSVPVLVAVETCDLVESVGVSLDFGDVRAPEVLTFDKAGGSREIALSTDRLDQLTVRWRTKIDYVEPSWPVLTVEGTSSDIPPIVIVKPDVWARQFDVVACVVEDGRILEGGWGQGNVLAVNVRYENPALPAAITASAQIHSSDELLTLAYPVPPDAPHGRITIGVIGSIDGQLVQGSRDIDPEEGLAAILAENGSVRFITATSEEPQPESDPVVRRLRAAGRPPLVRRDLPAKTETGGELTVLLQVSTVPQPTTVSCWAAAVAMVVGCRDRVALSPTEVADLAGLDVDTSYAWPQIRPALAVWGLVEEGPRSSPPEEWAALLREWGPIWVVETGAPYHAVVVGGISGDGTPDGTSVRLYNPWPPGVGCVEQKTFTEFQREFDLGRGSGAAMVHG